MILRKKIFIFLLVFILNQNIFSQTSNFIFGMKPYISRGYFFNKNIFCNSPDEKPYKNLFDAEKIGWATLRKSKQFISTSILPEYYIEQEKPVEKTINPIITWIGHATVLIQINGFNIITDPLFGSFSCLYPRYTNPGIERKNLPHIDVILISHNHKDHCDLKSLSSLVKDQPFCLVGLGLKKKFEKMGFKQVEEEIWWESKTINKDDNKIILTFLPAWHWANRGLFDINKTLWGSWMIQSDSTTIYFGGDSAYKEHFSLIAKKFPNINIALLPIGPVNPHNLMKDTHMGPSEAVQAFIDLNATTFIPIHWGTFGLGTDCFLDPIELLTHCWTQSVNTQLKNKNLQILRFGQKFCC